MLKRLTPGPSKKLRPPLPPGLLLHSTQAWGWGSALAPPRHPPTSPQRMKPEATVERVQRGVSHQTGRPPPQDGRPVHTGNPRAASPYLLSTCTRMCVFACAKPLVEGAWQEPAGLSCPQAWPVPHRGRWAGPSSARPAGTWSTNSHRQGPLEPQTTSQSQLRLVGPALLPGSLSAALGTHSPSLFSSGKVELAWPPRPRRTVPLDWRLGTEAGSAGKTEGGQKG